MVGKGAGLISAFLEILTTIRTEILEKFELPIGITYWRFLILLGFVSIVINALVNKVPADVSAHAIYEDKQRKRKAERAAERASRKKGK